MTARIRKTTISTRLRKADAKDSRTTRTKSGSDIKVRASDNIRVADEVAAVVERARSRGAGTIEDVFKRVPSKSGC